MKQTTLLIIVLLMSVPAAAASNVVVTATDDDVNCVTITYVSDTNLIRAFGLTIDVNDANIVKVEAVDENYRIYPGQIVIDTGEITDYNTPYAPGDLGDANVSIEMGSLYTMDANFASDANAGYGMQPEQAGVLLKFYVDSTPCSYSVSENPGNGGVVMEDPDESANVSIILTDGNISNDCPKCMAETNPAYADWVAYNEPNCWCYQYHCIGDVDGKKSLLFWVYTNDLALIKSCYAKLDPLPEGCICADFDHKKQLIFRVYTNDLAILKSWYAKPNPPENICGDPPDENFCFWLTP